MKRKKIEYSSQFLLLSSRRFLPLFITQFFGAFNDSVFKNALVILITYVTAEQAGMNAQIMVTMAAGVFILPFFLFSATAGQLADKFDKAKLIRWIKLVEILLMAAAAAGFFIGSIPFLMVVLFLMGSQSAFFGPLKFGILPDQLDVDELISGNALIEAGTFLAILVGTILGGLLILTDGGIFMVSILVVVVAAIGWLASFFVPSTRPAVPDLAVRVNFLRETWEIIKYTAADRSLFLCILGISWFWLIGSTFLAQFPTLCKEVIGANEEVVTLFLSLFSVGIALGSLMCNRLLKGEVHATYVPLGAIGMTLFMADLFFATRNAGMATTAELIGVRDFLGYFTGWRIAFDLTMLAIAGGIFIVPLNAILQHRSEAGRRARNIAGNNVMNALFMVVSAVGTAALLQLNFTVPQVFLIIAILNTAVAVYICQLLPGALAKGIVAWLLELFYHVEVDGLKNFSKLGDRVLIVANHLSFIDAALIAAFVPDQLTFAIHTHWAKHRFVKFFMSLAKTFPIDPTNPLATRSLINCVKDGEKVVIFPEGRITVTGSLMKVYEGPGMIADKTGAQILPVRLEGAQYTPFSRLRGKVRIRLFPKIIVRFLEPRTISVPPEISGLVDIERKPLSYSKLITASFVLGREIAKKTDPGEQVGVLLPNMAITAVTFFSMIAYGRVPAMLNFSTGSKNVVLACHTARIKTVYTSRRFIEMGKLTGMVGTLTEEGVNLVYLEDLREQVSISSKILGVLAGRFPHLAYRITAPARDPDSPCVVLFTSGTEGAPKGVVLTHSNLQSNRYQASSRIDFGPTDSPLHYRIVPELCYDINATIMFGTDTFLTGYARFAHPYDFYSLRYVFAGAEKLKDETRRVWSEKFGVRVFEGYGATETAPVLSMNTPMQNNPDSVGRLMPGIRYKLEKVAGIAEGGKMLVAGPNIMAGYLLAEDPGVLKPPTDGWYDTGDIVDIDEQGYVLIKGRAKRFAKIGGEMVSLAAVESYAAKLWPAHSHAVINVPDERKGEKLVLVTSNQEAEVGELISFAKREGIADIAVPKIIRKIEKIPLLGSGKTDFVGVRNLIENEPHP
ncbi:MAG: MFS transporter [Deltaproteobacteria bacterium]